MLFVNSMPLTHVRTMQLRTKRNAGKTHGNASPLHRAFLGCNRSHPGGQSDANSWQVHGLVADVTHVRQRRRRRQQTLGRWNQKFESRSGNGCASRNSWGDSDSDSCKIFREGAICKEFGKVIKLFPRLGIVFLCNWEHNKQNSHNNNPCLSYTSAVSTSSI